MSIYIKGMKMPKPKIGEKAFYPCMICAHPDGTVNITVNDEIGCVYPLVEVLTPHGDLIDRSKIPYCDYDFDSILENTSFYNMRAAEDEWIEDMPAIIEAED